MTAINDNRWIESKYYLVKENRLSDLGLENVEDEELLSDIAFRVSEIESFRKMVDEDDEPVEEDVFVHFKSGLGIVLAMNYNDLLKIIKENYVSKIV
jgi:hypothetical protein